MNKVFNPFFKVGKTVWKGVKVAGMSAAGVGAFAAANHFLVEMVPAIVGATAPEPYASLISLILASAVSGGLGAVDNFRKHYKVTPEELAEKIKADEAAQSAM